MSTEYAHRTKVPAEKSRAEIEMLLRKHNATATAIFTSANECAVAFEMEKRHIKMRIRFKGEKISEALYRQRWRALLLTIKAKLVSIADGIETFDEAFLPHIVMPDGQTVGDTIKGPLALAYQHKKMVPLLEVLK